LIYGIPLRRPNMNEHGRSVRPRFCPSKIPATRGTANPLLRVLTLLPIRTFVESVFPARLQHPVQFPRYVVTSASGVGPRRDSFASLNRIPKLQARVKKRTRSASLPRRILSFPVERYASLRRAITQPMKIPCVSRNLAPSSARNNLADYVVRARLLFR